MPRKITHNIALTFNDKMNVHFVEFAQRHLSDIQAGYILGVGSIPHITLTHLNISDEQAQITQKVFEALECPIESIDVLNIYSAARENIDRLYCGYTVRKSKALVEYQEYVAESLRREGIETTTGSGDLYSPHITLGNFSGALAPAWDMDAAICEGTHLDTSLSFGYSDDIGQFTEMVETK